jgi:penicillin-binding protein 1A
MRVALAKKPQQEERAQPDGVVRENDDWVYAEFAETPALSGIDLDQAPPAPNAVQPVDGTEPPPAQPPQPQPKPQQQQPSNTLF